MNAYEQACQFMEVTHGSGLAVQGPDRGFQLPTALRIVSDEQIPGYRRLADALHAGNTAALVQLSSLLPTLRTSVNRWSVVMVTPHW